MHAAVVVRGLHVAAHAVRLRVLAEPGVVVGGAGMQHAAQRDALDARKEQVAADQPVGGCGVLAERVLLDQHPEHVGDRLVERPGLAGVRQGCGVLDDAVGELVADHVEAGGEPAEDLPVPVAEDHAGAVPEGVLVTLAVVDGAEQPQAARRRWSCGRRRRRTASRWRRSRRRPHRLLRPPWRARPRRGPSCRAVARRWRHRRSAAMGQRLLAWPSQRGGRAGRRCRRHGCGGTAGPLSGWPSRTRRSVPSSWPGGAAGTAGRCG